MLRIMLLCAALALPGAATAQARMVGDLPRKDGKPLESLAGLETEYGVIRTSEGVRLRSVMTRPAGAAGRLPAIFHTQAVSCGSLEPLPTDRPTVLGGLAQRSGMVLVRIDRAGTGDSEGPACSELDYDTEVRHYREAFDQVATHPWIDSDRIIIYGSSLGSTTAPLVAQGKKVAGIAVQGGGAHSYLERMLNFDRLYLERSGQYRPEQIPAEIALRTAFHQAYLIGQNRPDAIALQFPALAGVWRGIRGGAEAPPHYGRPYAWHWQAAQKPFLAAWASIEAPVFVAYAEFDQFEPRSSHEIIARTLNAVRPGSARFVELKGVDHSIWRYPDPITAYRGEGGERAPETLLNPMLAWLDEIL